MPINTDSTVYRIIMKLNNIILPIAYLCFCHWFSKGGDDNEVSDKMIIMAFLFVCLFFYLKPIFCIGKGFQLYSSVKSINDL